MRVLVLGAAGMLGHRVFLSLRESHEVWGIVRDRPTEYRQVIAEGTETLLGPIDVLSFDEVVRATAKVQPEAIVNCVGIVKQSPLAQDSLLSISTNSLLPHRLALLADSMGARLIHISTDCVFSGKKGNYSESDTPDAYDLYGRTKLLGEVTYGSAVTLRTSIIGRELHGWNGLLEWLLRTRQPVVQGYRQAIFSGLTTLELSRVISTLLHEHSKIRGLFHVASQPINKYALLCLLKDAYGLRVSVTPVDEPQIDRSLDGFRFSSETGYTAPEWRDMIRQMVKADSFASSSSE